MLDSEKYMIDKLFSQNYRNYIETLIGKPEKDMQPCFIVWSHKPPKPVFKLYEKFSSEVFSRPLIVLIDDITPYIIFMNREEIEKITEKYEVFFDTKKTTTVRLSDIISLNEYLKLSNYISLSTFYHYIPKARRNSEIYISDLFHFLTNIAAYYFSAKNGAEVFLLGKNSLGRFFAARETIKKTLSRDVSGIVFKVIKVGYVENERKKD